MSETVNFGYGWSVEHEGLTSHVFHNGQIVKTFKNSERAWSDAERFASDKMFKEMYG